MHNELHIVNYFTIHLIFLIWERSAVTRHSKGKKHKDKEISRKSLPISFFAKKKSDFASLTMLDFDQGQCPSASSTYPNA